MKKRITILISIIVSICLCIFPFFISTKADSLLSVLSISFTAIGAFSSLATLVIAILLYQRFGLDSKLIEKRFEAVLELGMLLKGKVIRVQNEKGIYFIRTKIVDMKKLKNELPMFAALYQRKVTLKAYDDFLEAMSPILKYKGYHWLPDEIKNNMKFFDFTHCITGQNLEDINLYAEFNYGTEKEKDAVIPCPELTVEQYIVGYSKLINSIVAWLKKHSNIVIDLELDRNNSYE